MKRGTTSFLKIAVLIIGIVVLSLCIFALPSLASDAAKMNPEFSHLQYPILFGLYLTVIPFFFALYQAVKLLGYIESNQAFSELAVHALNRIKHSAGVIIILYIIGMVILVFENALHPSIGIIGIVITFATFVILIFTAVLQELLKNALKIKLENDLTV